MTNDLYDACVALAYKAHFGQYDKAGAPYIQHVERVVGAVAYRGRETMALAWLHDVVEDHPDLLPGLRPSLSAGLLFCVQALTRRHDEAYAVYIQRVANTGGPDTIAVKIADLHDHLRPGAELVLPRTLRRRYTNALGVLYQAY